MKKIWRRKIHLITQDRYRNKILLFYQKLWFAISVRLIKPYDKKLYMHIKFDIIRLSSKLLHIIIPKIIKKRKSRLCIFLIDCRLLLDNYFAIYLFPLKETDFFSTWDLLKDLIKISWDSTFNLIRLLENSVLLIQQTKMNWNGQRWIRFVRVKFRFWSFESISIQLKFPSFFESILIHMKE